MKDITVIIPTFNERDHISKSITIFFKNLHKLKLDPEVIIIDDSTDNTYEELRKVQSNYKNLKIIRRRNRTGVGSAIRRGIQVSTKKYIILHMADAPNDTKYFPAIIENLKHHDLVQTSRFFPGCRMVGYPFKKKVGNWLCNNFIKISFNEYSLKDFSSLFKGFNVSKIKKLNLSANEFDLGLEITLKSMRMKYKIIEVPVNWHQRKEGSSKLNLSKFAKNYFYRVIKIWLTYWP
jgi:glycosyltransferase involved in cell wall biosynthesis